MVFDLNPLTTKHTLTILPTYKCTAACQDCCFGSNPSIEGRIPQGRILKYIENAALLGIKTIVFSGGEAFVLGRDLDNAIWHATKLGMGTRVVTNGYWAIDQNSAIERLKKIQNSGLTEINFSTGDFHQKFVPIERVINGTMAAVSLGIRCVIMIEIRRDRTFSKKQLLSNEKIKTILSDNNRRNLFSIVESPWMPMYDSDIIPQKNELLLNRKSVFFRKGCNSILSTFVVTPNEKFGACCGLTRELIPELNLGSLKDRNMEEMINEAFDDFLKIWIFVEGPEKILEWAASKDHTIEWENKYSHVCHACLALYKDEKVRKVIKEYHEEKMLDVYFRYHLLTCKDVSELENRHMINSSSAEFIFG